MNWDALKPNIQILKKYFPYYHNIRKQEETMKSSQQDETAININAFNKALKEFNLEDHHDNILSATLEFSRRLPDLIQRKNLNKKIKNIYLEYFELHKFLIENKDRAENTEIVLRDKELKTNAVRINYPGTIIEVFELLEEYLTTKLFIAKFPEGFVIPAKDFTDEMIENKVVELRSEKRGRKPGMNPHIVKFFKCLLDYLNNESWMKVGPGIDITNNQCEYLLQYLLIFGIENEKELSKHDAKVYIRTLLSNERIKVSALKS